ncbi:dTMP kinase [Candidatus Blochmannia ocreatus (nom. nud.)]|uniref:Thymidylate kinase n=1 Tax=Candidatus Blochmannia ocreatus (nom. nud.) TaxID=251538 RepID=A0ABY4SSD7_9ENTR|nr:dTMP kinase [Candidatus Blochmannia ocreatus]URJ24906.1 dTMP kinase [Candidatus Blochmannia ocreatus]
MNSKFIVVEGLDGSGKTTVVYAIKRYLYKKYGIVKITTTRDPGGTAVADLLRTLIKYGGYADESVHDISELLMIYAARFQLVTNVIKPALSQGYWVIGDRYNLSSQAYQGGGRGVDELLLKILSKKIMDFLSPNLTLYLDISPEISVSRIKNRMFLDRIEKESLIFFRKVRSCYWELISDSTEKIIVIDASQSLYSVCRIVFKFLDWWLQDLLRV